MSKNGKDSVAAGPEKAAESTQLGTYEEFAHEILDGLMEFYQGPMFKKVVGGGVLIETFTAFLLNPTKIVLHMGRTHIGVEYYGPERAKEILAEHEMEAEVVDYSKSDENFFDRVVGFPMGSDTVRMPVIGQIQDLVMPSNEGFDRLHQLGWNFDAQDMIMALNSGGIEVPPGEGGRLVNAFFFGADEKGLVSRHIKWMDFIPIEYDDSGTETDNFKVPFGMLAELWKIDAEYIYPLPHFQPMRLQTINRFIEVFGTSNHSEPEITKFLAQKENQFILLTKFGATQLHAEVLCEWQDTERAAIKPDFFVVQPDGYADIVEFKLPNLKATALVGTENRERLSAELASYVAQTRVYVEYFESSANREWVKNKYGFSVRHPDRILVVGRRYDLESDSWRAVASDFPNLRVISYDDLVDGVVAQFYS